jgi:hypothetical protein
VPCRIEEVGVIVAVGDATGNAGTEIEVDVGRSGVRVGVAGTGVGDGTGVVVTGRVLVTLGVFVAVGVRVSVGTAWEATDLKAFPLDNERAIAAIQMPMMVSQNGLRKTFGHLAFNEAFKGANLIEAGNVKTIVFLANDPKAASR